MEQEARGLALVRLVNGLIEPLYGGAQVPIVRLAAEIGLPYSLVNIRHQVTHQMLPPLHFLVLASHLALEWLYRQYWITQSPVDTRSTIIGVLERYRTGIRSLGFFSEATSLSPTDPSVKQKLDILTSLGSMLSAPDILREHLCPSFVEDGFLIPKTKEDTRWKQIPPLLEYMWFPALHTLSSRSNQFASTMLVILADRLTRLFRKSPSQHEPSLLLLWFSKILNWLQNHRIAGSGDLVSESLECTLLQCNNNPSEWATLLVAEVANYLPHSVVKKAAEPHTKPVFMLQAPTDFSLETLEHLITGSTPIDVPPPTPEKVPCDPRERNHSDKSYSIQSPQEVADNAPTSTPTPEETLLHSSGAMGPLSQFVNQNYKWEKCQSWSPCPLGVSHHTGDVHSLALPEDLDAQYFGTFVTLSTPPPLFLVDPSSLPSFLTNSNRSSTKVLDFLNDKCHLGDLSKTGTMEEDNKAIHKSQQGSENPALFQPNKVPAWKKPKPRTPLTQQNTQTNPKHNSSAHADTTQKTAPPKSKPPTTKTVPTPSIKAPTKSSKRPGKPESKQTTTTTAPKPKKPRNTQKPSTKPPNEFEKAMAMFTLT
ncbi:ribosomal biogenesis protein LAS1 [Pelomyxa schiedti]|nr:ribosomal biogenesis protein LAS1 [Pelomyxa schiedti]